MCHIVLFFRNIISLYHSLQRYLYYQVFYWYSMCIYIWVVLSIYYSLSYTYYVFPNNTDIIAFNSYLRKHQFWSCWIGLRPWTAMMFAFKSDVLSFYYCLSFNYTSLYLCFAIQCTFDLIYNVTADLSTNYFDLCFYIANVSNWWDFIILYIYIYIWIVLSISNFMSYTYAFPNNTTDRNWIRSYQEDWTDKCLIHEL